MNGSQNAIPRNGTSSMSSSSAALGIAILSIAIVIGIPGNLFVIWTILCRMRKRSVTCILILNLAMADVVVLLMTPFFLHFLSVKCWVFGNGICKFCHYFCCVNMFASITIMTFMSLDRFLAIWKPFISQEVRTKGTVFKILVGLWIWSFLLALPMIFYKEVKPYGPIEICVATHASYRHVVFQYLSETILGFLAPFTIITISYSGIGFRLQNTRFQRKRRTGKLISMIVITFALFWLPYHIVNLIQVSGVMTSNAELAKTLITAAKTARPNLTALAFVSSSVNPVLYAFAGSNFIRTAKGNFIAKLFEGTSEASSIRKFSRALREQSAKCSVELSKVQETKSITNQAF
ncbi:leukotriene B4 receptor 1-like [Protopterus annectens]|uniref:leukotriene B4 receptor 1-like n=1 Tax=Protopterus annectens TaxID=7888 RepID=UPI001CFC0EEF|nr:leukotriene B4 receptor 1-like [Protopterus annectens]